MAVPSMLTVAPIGKTNWATLGSTLFFSVAHFIITGIVAALKQTKSLTITIVCGNDFGISPRNFMACSAHVFSQG